MGCFPAGTKIKTLNGPISIEDIRVGDEVLRPEGTKEFRPTVVREVIEAEEELINLVTSHDGILTTADQLFLTFEGGFKKTTDLMSDLVAYVLDEEVVFVQVKAIIQRPDIGRVKVYHLRVDKPHIYVSGFFVVHNKGGGGSSTSSTEASIAPELRPLFKQTGNILQRVQTFQPRFTINPFASQAYSFPFSFSAPSVGGGVLGAGGVPELPTINMVQDSTGTFVPAPTGLTPQEQARLNELRQGIIGPEFNPEDPKEAPFADEWNRLIAKESGTTGSVLPSASSLPGNVVPSASFLPDSILDEFLFPQPQFIPQATPGQLDILGRQRQRAFGPMMTAEEARAAEIARTFGLLRGPEREALDTASTLGFARPEEAEAIRLGRGFGELRPGERAAMDIAGRLGDLTPAEAAALGLSTTFGQPRGPERSALNIAGQAGDLTPAEAAALGLSTTFGRFRSPEIAALEQIRRFTGGEIGESPATQAAMRAVREPVLNELALAGLGNSGAVGTELGGAFAPILAKELEIRSGVVPVLAQMGEALRRGDVQAAGMFQRAGEAQRQGDLAGAAIFQRTGEALRAGDVQAAGMFQRAGEAQRQGDLAGAAILQRAGEAQRAGDVQEAQNLMSIGNSARQGSIAATNLQAQIGAALRAGDVATATFLAQQGATLVERESKLLAESGASEEAVRQLAAQQFEALQADLLRRQGIATGMTTGVLGNFPSITGQSTVTRTKGSGGGGLGK